MAFENGLCILVADETGNEIFIENNLGSFSVFNSDLNSNWGRFIFQLKNDLKKAEKRLYNKKIYQNEHVKNQEIFFCTTINSENYETPLYLYIEGSIEPIDSTVTIIREQLYLYYHYSF